MIKAAATSKRVLRCLRATKSRSVISSARKQGRDILTALTLGPDQLAVELNL